MGYATVTAIKSGKMEGLVADIATAIAAGKQPYGAVFTDPADGLLCMLMTTGQGNAGMAAYAADGAIDPEVGLALLTKAGVGAYTLAAPVRDGDEITIVNRTANAHVVTSTNLLDDGVTGGPKDTATFAAFAGSALHLRGYGGVWNVISKNVVTIAAV